MGIQCRMRVLAIHGQPALGSGSFAHADGVEGALNMSYEINTGRDYESTNSGTKSLDIETFAVAIS